MRKILLNKNSGKTSINTTNVLPINLERDISIFHDELMSTNIDTMEVYNNEKNESTKHRFIFTMFPICTNVLHNHLTEVIYQEGHSSSCKPLLNTSNNGVNILNKTISQQTLTRLQAIRNTEYSNSGMGITYHCGSDIFNNHLLRNKEDIIIAKRQSRKNYSLYQSRDAEQHDYSNYDSFNTIGDYFRDNLGNYIISKFPSSNHSYVYAEKPISGYTPIYQYDTIMSFEESYETNIKRKDGWIGFNNPSTFHIPVSGTVTNGYYVNKCMNDKEACEFIDLCPERDLFSFTPKKNVYKKRLEYNWHYFFTYPAESIYNDGNVLIGKGYGLPLTPFNIIGSSKDIYYKESNASSGVKTMTLCSVIKHNLNAGDKVKIILQNGEDYICTVKEIGLVDGTEKDHYFTINKSDIEETVLNSNNPPRRFVKIVSGFECEYYFRKFKKFDNNFKTSINRLAFADTVYGDDISQIIFNEDINIEGYVDNLGRPLTEIYLTVIKNNSGYKEWYESNTPNYNDNSIEFSHVFGKVTSGLDIPHYVTGNFPILRRQHNIVSNLSNYNVSIKSKITPIFLEEDLTNKNEEFYGDLVEFNPITVNETILEVVKHRFNTAQRETSNIQFNTIFHDEIMGDQYDGSVYGTNNVSGQTRIVQLKMNEGYANLDPEGYIYNPHYKITIKELSDVVKQLTDTPITILDNATLNGKDLKFSTDINYGLLLNDVVSVLDYEDNTLYRFHVKEYIKNGDVYNCVAEGYGKIINFNGVIDKRFQTFKHNLETPEYAYMLPDGTGRHLWREVIKPSELPFTSALYNTVFTNGAFYHHVNIVFPVQRQDPFHLYGLYIVGADGETQIKNNFAITSTEIDISNDVYIPENEYKSCY